MFQEILVFRRKKDYMFFIFSIFRPFSKCSPCEMNKIMADIMMSGASITDVQIVAEGCRLGLQNGMVKNIS